MRFLFIGDIVGKGGRRAVRDLVPALRDELALDFVIANGENMAGGGGMTKRCVRSLLPTVDVITGGDHMWDQKEFLPDIASFPNVLRPANVSPEQPGHGYNVFTAPNGMRVTVMVLLGRTFVATPADDPFAAADRILDALTDEATITVVDMHAEATSEKIAMGRHLDGRATAVLGTHTHVVTADEQLLPGGTAYQTDVGMVGSRESVLGRSIPAVLHRFTTGMPARFDVVEKNIRLHATLVECDETTGKATHIERVVRDEPTHDDATEATNG